MNYYCLIPGSKFNKLTILDRVEIRKENDSKRTSGYKDIWFHYSMTNPRKRYHKILKFFSDLVEF